MRRNIVINHDDIASGSKEALAFVLTYLKRFISDSDRERLEEAYERQLLEELNANDTRD